MAAPLRELMDDRLLDALLERGADQAGVHSRLEAASFAVRYHLLEDGPRRAALNK